MKMSLRILCLLGIEVEGRFASRIDTDGEVQEAEAGCAVVPLAVLQLEPEARVLVVEAIPQLTGLVGVPHQGGIIGEFQSSPFFSTIFLFHHLKRLSCTFSLFTNTNEQFCVRISRGSLSCI